MIFHRFEAHLFMQSIFVLINPLSFVVNSLNLQRRRAKCVDSFPCSFCMFELSLYDSLAAKRTCVL